MVCVSYHLPDPSSLIEPLVTPPPAPTHWLFQIRGKINHLYKCEVTLSSPKVSAQNILDDKLNYSSKEWIHFKHFFVCLGDESYLFPMKVFLLKSAWLSLVTNCIT